MTIEPEDYITKNGAGGSIKLYVKGDVEETGQSFATQDVVELTKPTLEVTVSYCDSKLKLVLTINAPRKRCSVQIFMGDILYTCFFYKNIFYSNIEA